MSLGHCRPQPCSPRWKTEHPASLHHQVDDQDIALIRQSGSHVVLCPRSNAALEVGKAPVAAYLHRANTGIGALFLGMNPGPWGMAQTGIPFGEIEAVKGWMKINSPVGQPAKVHPKRPVTGFECPRSEVSGKRLWGWAQARFKTPGRFFSF